LNVPSRVPARILFQSTPHFGRTFFRKLSIVKYDS
jgi:hypothetical protein